jgi:hypothetical protein
MSRMYRIQISESVTRIVHVGDAVASDLEILPILARERMREILAAELGARGFARDGDHAVREQDGVRVSVDLGTGRVTAEVSTTQEVVMEGSDVATAAQPNKEDAAAGRMRERLRSQLERKLDRREKEMQEEATQRLEGRLRDLRGEMDQVVSRVTIDALKERAAQLGEIEELHEDASTGELTIKVKV